MEFNSMDNAASANFLKHKFWAKYALDWVFALTLLPILMPLIVVVRVAMWLEARLDPVSDGPLFYLEERWTQGRPFRIIKFRTAYSDQPAGEVGRLTRVGVLLKKWYLDEIPQLINILQGDMTFVGPRPNVPWKAIREIEQEGMRSKQVLRAGLTGLVQLNKRESCDRQRYRTYEDAYLAKVEQRSAIGIVALDLEILLRTVPVLLRGEGM